LCSSARWQLLEETRKKMLRNIDLIPYREMVCHDDTIENYQKNYQKIQWEKQKWRIMI